MLCEKCNKKKVTLVYNENINGRARSFRLCADCAAAMQKSGELEDLGTPFPGFISPFMTDDEGFGESLDAALGAALGSMIATAPFVTASPPRISARKCPLCASTLADITSTGKVGCAKCYDTFSDELLPAIRRTHGAVIHTGRVPHAYRAKLERKNRLVDLKKQLKDAINTEQYERAASLRDEIKEMEKENL